MNDQFKEYNLFCFCLKKFRIQLILLSISIYHYIEDFFYNRKKKSNGLELLISFLKEFENFFNK